MIDYSKMSRTELLAYLKNNREDSEGWAVFFNQINEVSKTKVWRPSINEDNSLVMERELHDLISKG